MANLGSLRVGNSSLIKILPLELMKCSLHTLECNVLGRFFLPILCSQIFRSFLFFSGRQW